MQSETNTAKMESKPINQWIALNNVLRVYKLIGLGLVGLSIALTMVVFCQIFSDPVVVTIEDGVKTFYIGRKTAVTLEPKDVESLIKQFVDLRYTWSELNPDTIARNIAPISTKGLVSKVRLMLLNLRDKELKGQETQQGIANLKVNVTKTNVTATFDKILRIKNVPLIVPSHVSFNLIKKSATAWNPIGLYINGVVEHLVE